MELKAQGPVENLIFVTERLIEVMTREIEFLKNMQPQEIRDLQAEKTDLAQAYERCMETIKHAPEILSQAAVPSKEKLCAVTDKFNLVLAENERSLRAVKSVSERLLNVIVNAVAEKQAGASYTGSGAIGSDAMAKNQALSLAVNERL